MNKVAQSIMLCIASAAFLAAISLWMFSPPKQFSSNRTERVATQQVVPLSSSISSPDTSSRLQACMPDALSGDDIPVIVLDSPVDASSSSEVANPEQPAAFPPASSPPSTSYFLRVNQTFATEKEAIDYADNVLSEYSSDECWIGVRGTAGNQRFTLLVGPFRTRKDAIRPQSRLTGAKIRTLLVDESFLRRFRSVTLVPDPPQPIVSSIASATPANQFGSAAFPTLAGPVPSVYKFCL